MNLSLDKTAKQHYAVIFISLAICLFLYIDSYLIPTTSVVQKVQDLNMYRSGRNGKSKVYTMTVDGKAYDIPSYLFSALSRDGDAIMEKSAFTGSLQCVGVIRENEIWMYEAGYLNARFGRIAVPAIIIGCIVMLLFFRIIDYVKGRANLTYALFICALLLLFAHLDLNFI